ncbi:MAG: hypothetical protein FWF51_12720 [Chitinivibrionia bacterium]|nr:hypothetical protein [Chitinivibrionia bacterium]
MVTTVRETKVLTNKKSLIAAKEENKDLFGFGGILKGLDLPTDKKELRKIYYERHFA